MATTGVYPPDPNTPTGQVRLLIGDVDATDVSDGTGTYTYFGDYEISNALVLSDDSVKRATGALIRQLALNAALTGISIKADDLAIDNRTRGTSLIEIANSYTSEADDEDRTEAQSTFILVGAPNTGRRIRHPFTIQPNPDPGYGDGGYGF